MVDHSCGRTHYCHFVIANTSTIAVVNSLGLYRILPRRILRYSGWVWIGRSLLSTSFDQMKLKTGKLHARDMLHQDPDIIIHDLDNPSKRYSKLHRVNNRYGRC